MKSIDYKRLIISRNNLIFIALMLFYRILLDLLYVKCICVKFSYWSYNSESTPLFTIVSWVVLLILLIPIKNMSIGGNSLSDEVLIVLFILSIVPFTTLIKYNHFKPMFVFYNFLFWSILFFSHAFLKKISFNKLRISNKRIMNDSMLKAITVFFFVVLFFISAYYTRLRISISFSESLDIRNDSIELNIPGVLNYLYLWSQVIVPVLLAYFIKKKNVVYSVICIAIQLLSYGINGMKTTLFVVFVVVAISFIPKMSVSATNRMMVIIVSVGCILGIIETLLFKTYNLSGIIFLRVFFLPNSISYSYYDFFSNQTPDYLRASFLRHFGFTSPYENIPQIIGTKYYHSDMRCNDGLIGDAFANFGVLGVVVLPVMIAIVLKAMDEKTKGLEVKFYLGVSFVIAIRLMSNYLITSLLSYGFILLIVLMGLIERNEISADDSVETNGDSN